MIKRKPEKNKMAYVSEYKKKVVKDFTELLKEYPIVGSVDMENLPTSQLQNMRKQLRGKAVLRMTKRRLIRIAMNNGEEERKGIKNLQEHLKGMTALIFTKENPFKLYQILQKSKSTAPAKPGQEVPNDVVVEPGPTPFAPGPIIGELGAFGIKTAVENGKIAIKSRTVIVKKGEKVSKKAAAILSRLGIQPMEVGLNLVAVYENGEIFTKDVLAIDEKEYMNNICMAFNHSLNLAFEIAFPIKETIEILISRAFTDSKALALSENILADAVVEELVAKANSEMMSLKSQIKIEEPKEEVKEEKTVEDNKEKTENIDEKKEEVKEIKEEEKEVKKEEVKAEEVKEEVKEVKEEKEEVKKETEKEEAKKE